MMDKYQKMLDEIASKYPELEEAVTDFEGALMDAMPEGEEGAAPLDAAAEDEDSALPPMPMLDKKAKKPPFGGAADDEEDEPADEEDEDAFQF